MLSEIRTYLMHHEWDCCSVLLSVAGVYLLAINAVTFFLYGIDKYKAKHAKWRVPESTLLWLCAAGGSIGGWLGMKTWHHKTQHAKFRLGIPLILLAQAAVVALTVYYLYKR